MVKKKISGQTIAIIILAIVLLLTIGFGGVYAYYTARSNKAVTGKIVMANLKIALVSPSGDSISSEKSEIVISNGVNVVPGQSLENSPLIVQNLSSTDIFLVVVYEINATKTDEGGQKVDIIDKHKEPVLGVDGEYINSIFTSENTKNGRTGTTWVDFVFKAADDDTNANTVVINEQGDTCKAYRCLVSRISFAKETNVTVIAENKLALAREMGDEYQESSISFTFQAYAISANSNWGFVEGDSSADRCQKLVSAIYESQDSRFLNVEINS